MAQTSYPFDGMSITETEFSLYFREFRSSGVAASADSLALKVAGAGAGMTVTVQPGFAIVRGFAYNSSAVETLTIGASASQARVDRVILRLNPTSNSIVLAVLAGTPGSSSPAALTQTDTDIYEIGLAQVSVGANVTSIGAPSVTDTRTFTTQDVGNWSNSTRPSSPRQGQLGYNRTTAAWEFWTGSTWDGLLPSTPIGAIVAYGGSVAPAGWHLCDGTAHGSTALTAVTGSSLTPDLRSRFIVGAGPGYGVGATGGANEVTLSSAQSGLVAHAHTAGSGAMSANAEHSHSAGTEWMNQNHIHSHSAWTSADGEHGHNHYASNLLSAEGQFDPAGAGHRFLIGGGETIGGGGSAHGHGIGVSATDINHTHNVTVYGTNIDHTHAVTVNAVASAAASQAHENRPPYYALTYIIRKA